MQYRFIVHARPHFDELTAVQALGFTPAGNEVFPDFRRAGLELHNPAIHDDGRSEDAWLKDGVIFVGVRNGWADDHPHQKNPGECTFTLVTELLGLNSLPEWAWLGRRVYNADRNRVDAYHFANVVKMLTRYNKPETCRQLVGHAMHALLEQRRQCSCEIGNGSVATILKSEAKWKELLSKMSPQGCEGEEALHVLSVLSAVRRHSVADQAALFEDLVLRAIRDNQQLFLDTVRDIQRLGRLVEVPVQGRKEPIRLAVGRTTSERFSAAARSRQGFKADVVLHFTPREGKRDMVYISFAESTGIKYLGRLVEMLRRKECDNDPTAGPLPDEPGCSEGGCRWHYDSNGTQIFSGTITHPHQVVTVLAEEEIVSCVQEFLSTINQRRSS